MTISQLSIFAENKPGTLAEITHALGGAGVDIRAMSIADTSDFGIFRMIVSNTEKAKEALTNIGCIVSVTSVIAVLIPDSPGALNDILTLFAESGVNLEYMYAFVTMSKQNAYAVLRVEDNAQAIELLSKKGIQFVSDEDIKAL